MYEMSNCRLRSTVKASNQNRFIESGRERTSGLAGEQGGLGEQVEIMTSQHHMHKIQFGTVGPVVYSEDKG